jgi:hypothetical protein
MQYNPSQPFPNISWLQAEFRRIAETFESGSPALRLISTNVAPTREIEGEIRMADGVNWNPGAGPGTYIFRGGIWQLIEAGFNRNSRSMSFFLGS